MKKILIPTDFSNHAQRAVDYGLEFAKRIQAEVHFWHGITTPVEWKNLPVEKEKLFPETKAQIGRAKNELQNLVKHAESFGIKANCTLVYNQAVDEIKAAKLANFDLVIMGTHGKSDIISFMSSNTINLIRNANIPVLVVKENNNFADLNSIVIATDYHPETKEAFWKIINLARDLQVSKQLLYVNVPYNFQETDEIERKMNSFLSQYPEIPFSKHVINARNEERGIQLHIEKTDPDMVALITHGRSGLMNIINPSLTESIINHLSIPVLCVNMKKVNQPG